jgi:hypothetical protein
MEKRFMSSIKISQEIHNKMLHSIVEQSSSLRGKSKWIISAIEDFLNITDFYEFVDIAADMEELTETISFRLPEAIMQKLEDAVIIVRRKYPAMEGVKSHIIRASIIQKLLR